MESKSALLRFVSGVILLSFQVLCLRAIIDGSPEQCSRRSASSKSCRVTFKYAEITAHSICVIASAFEIADRNESDDIRVCLAGILRGAGIKRHASRVLSSGVVDIWNRLSRCILFWIGSPSNSQSSLCIWCAIVDTLLLPLASVDNIIA